jgi:hypothetical protein
MSYRVYQVNKKTGVTYVYEATSIWDKEKKQPRNKQVCIGKIDPETGEFVPSKRLDQKQAAIAAFKDSAVTATTRIIGPSLLLDKITTELGLDKIVKNCFPNDYQQILCMAYYLTIRGGPLCHCEAWSKSHAHPYNKPLTSQRISEILSSITIDERQSFFSKWSRKVLENDYLCYDITSISSYAELNEYVKYGYNRDGDKLKQINLAMLFGQKSGLPVYYNRLPGNIGDVNTLHNFLKTFWFLNLPKLHLIMDKGFYSQKNIDALLAAKDKFTIAVPTRVWVREAIDAARNAMYGPDGYRKVDGEVIYVHTKLHPWGKDRRRCYLHLYYNAHAAADNFDGFTEELLTYKEELETGQQVSGHEEFYKEFFFIKETLVRGRKVTYNNDAIQKYRNQYAGFQAILTNDIKDPVKTLRIYRDKDVVEKSFDDLKNQLDMKRLRIHSSPVMDGRLFVQFVSLIYMSALRREMRKTGLIDKYLVHELFDEMETLTKVQYTGKYRHIITEITKPQRLIMESLGVEFPA